tara:strand:- start:954 stop:1301 length:348 start_codon:yes stop_codon:yes gene_type:complete
MIRYLLALFLSIQAYASSLSLVAITHHACPVCLKWQKEVEPFYHLYVKKQDYPELKRYDVSKIENRHWVRDHVGPLTSLPTFALMKNDQVITSFHGYLNAQDFFQVLDDALEKPD